MIITYNRFTYKIKYLLYLYSYNLFYVNLRFNKIIIKLKMNSTTLWMGDIENWMNESFINCVFKELSKIHSVILL